MQLPRLPFFLSYFVFGVTIIALLGYSGFFSENLPWFYLINTPGQLLVIPLLLHTFYTYFAKQNKLFSVSACCVVIIFLLVSYHPGREFPVKAPATDTVTSRICSLNTGYFFETYEEEAFKKLQPRACDVLILQEVWASSTYVPILRELRERYYPDHYVVNYGEYVVFYPKAWTVTLSPSSEGGFLALQVRGDKHFTLLNVHLWNPITHKPKIDSNDVITAIPAHLARKLQETELQEKIDSLLKKNEPMLIIGDFNALSNAAIIQNLAKNTREIKVALLQNKNTYPSRHPFIKIDYAFTTVPRYSSEKQTIICDYVLSDHCLLILDIVL